MSGAADAGVEPAAAAAGESLRDVLLAALGGREIAGFSLTFWLPNGFVNLHVRSFGGGRGGAIVEVVRGGESEISNPRTAEACLARLREVLG